MICLFLAYVIDSAQIQASAESDVSNSNSESDHESSSSLDSSPLQTQHQTPACIPSDATPYVPLSAAEYAALLPRPLKDGEAKSLGVMQDFIFKLDAESAWRRQGRRMNQVERYELTQGRVRYPSIGLDCISSQHKMAYNLIKYHLNPFEQADTYANGGIEPAHVFY